MQNLKDTAKIEIDINDSKMGSVSGNGEYFINEEVTLKADPKSDFEFIGWFNKSDKLISKKLELKTTVNLNKKYFAKFRYDFNSENLSRFIKSVEDYRSLKIKTRDELIDLIDLSIGSLDQKIIEEMVYDLTKEISKKNDFRDYFSNIEKTEIFNEIYKAKKKAKEDYPDRFRQQLGLFHEEKRIILNYIENDKIRKEVKEYFNDYYGFTEHAAGFFKEIDYIEIKEKYGKYLSDEFNSYLDLKSEAILNQLYFEVYVMLSPDELATRMIKYETFMKTAENESLKKDIKESYMDCLFVLLNPKHLISYLNRYNQATYEYRMALDRLKKNNTAKVTSIAAKKMFDFVYSKEDFVLRSYSDNSEMRKNYENILSKVKTLLNEKYFISN